MPVLDGLGSLFVNITFAGDLQSAYAAVSAQSCVAPDAVV